MLYDVTLGE